MINYIWGLMIVIGIVYGIITGNIKEVSLASINSSKEAITLCITMLGVMSLWMGIMEVACKSGIVSSMTKVIMPLLKILFPDIPKGHIVNEYICSNFIMNFLGIAWAATPVGLKAMKELSKLNKQSEIASSSMCTFLIINVSSLQLIPINILAYRSQYGSINPGKILGVSIIATIISTLAAVIFAITARRFRKN